MLGKFLHRVGGYFGGPSATGSRASKGEAVCDAQIGPGMVDQDVSSAPSFPIHFHFGSATRVDIALC